MDRLESLPLLVDVQPAELLVHDADEDCPYLPGRTARMPLRLPVRRLTNGELDSRLERGDRRHGALFYRPTCARCTACQAIRLPAEFPFSKTHHRIVKRGDAALRVEIGPPDIDDERIALYDKHRFGRGLARDGSPPMNELSYQRFLVDSQCESFELRYYAGDRLVGLAITDRGERSLSAVYCYYDPDLGKLSLGTYSILTQLRLCQEWGLQHLYLGLYIVGCDAMGYKARFRPHERLIGEQWTRFE